MKKTGALIILMLFFCSLALAQPELPDAGVDVGSEDVEKIQGLIEGIPLDPDTGGLDEEKITGYKSKAEQRINAINEGLEKTDFVFMFVFGIPLRISWKFTYLFFLVVISLVVFHNLSNWVGMDKEWLNILLALGVTFILGYTKAFLFLINWIVEITSRWWWDLIVLGVLLIIIFIVAFGGKIGKKIAEKRKKTQEEIDREKLHGGAEVAEIFSKTMTED